jgi:hypothetical protein
MSPFRYFFGVRIIRGSMLVCVYLSRPETHANPGARFPSLAANLLINDLP